MLKQQVEAHAKGDSAQTEALGIVIIKTIHVQQIYSYNCSSYSQFFHNCYSEFTKINSP